MTTFASTIIAVSYVIGELEKGTQKVEVSTPSAKIKGYWCGKVLRIDIKGDAGA